MILKDFSKQKCTIFTKNGHVSKKIFEKVKRTTLLLFFFFFFIIDQEIFVQRSNDHRMKLLVNLQQVRLVDTLTFDLFQLIFISDKQWLDLQYDLDGKIKKPDDLEFEMFEPPTSIDAQLLNRIEGSLIGMALGDALGAHVEFRPNEYLVENPVEDLQGGGTWGLRKGQVNITTNIYFFFSSL